MEIAGQPICYTLELPYLDNSVNVSAIPAGSYHGTIRTDGDLGWRIALDGVPGRSNIEIHIGNYTSQTTGCTLVGTGVSLDPPSVSNSAAAIEKIKNAITAVDGAPINVLYTDPPPAPRSNKTE